MAKGITFARQTPSAGSTGPKPQRLSQYWVLAAVLVTLAILAVFAGVAWLGLGAERAAQQQHLQELATTLADALSERKTQLRAQLAELAADPRLRMAFEYADQANFAAEAERLQARVPLALSLRLVRLETDRDGVRILNEDTLPLSYAGIDLVRQAATSGEISQLEAHQLGQPDQAHLAIAGPVVSGNDQKLLGIIHLALPLSLLPQPHAEITRGRHFLFQQGHARSTAIISPKGALAPPAQALVARVEIPQTGLELVAWQPPAGVLESTWLWPCALGAGVLLLLNLLLLAILGKAQDRHLRKEIDQLNLGLGQIDLGQPPTKRTLHLVELQALDEGLRHMARRRAKSRAAPDEQAEASLVEGAAADLDLALNQPASPMAQPSELSTTASEQPARADIAKQLGNIPARVFRPYDIRGQVGSELNADFMRLLGQAVGTESQRAGSRAVLVGRDHRPSGAELTAALTEGLRASGCDVIDIGVVPTPVLYFTTHLAGNISGAMVTASHDPAQYNGVKLALAGKSATALDVAKLKQRLQCGEFHTGEGSYREQSVLADYFDEVEQNITFARPLKLVVDCGFSTPALVAPQLFRDLGCEVIETRCDLKDPRAGRESPDPTLPENLRELIDTLTAHQADLGLGFDSDGDRLGVVDSSGRFIPTDRFLMLLAADLLSRLPGSEIVFDVKCSRLLAQHISAQGGKPVMWKSGTAFIKEKREELKAPLAGDFNGHIVFGDRWNGFDDAFYAAARLIEVLSIDPRPSCEVFAELPEAIGTPEFLVPVAPGQELEIMSQVMETKARLSGVKTITIDGLRIESDKGWGLVRASNSESALAFRFEAANEATLEKLKDLFRRIMQSAAPKLDLPF